MAGDLHHTAQPPTLAAFRPWGSSAGAGRVRPAGAKIRNLRIYRLADLLINPEIENPPSRTFANSLILFRAV